MAISMGGGETPMSDINTTPLVDVMLVLLIIFLIAVPVAIQTVEQLEIPVFESVESKDKVENLQLTVTTTDAEEFGHDLPRQANYGLIAAIRRAERGARVQNAGTGHD